MRFLITGANRGLGLELTKQAIANGHEVIGTARNPAEAYDLMEIAKRVLPLDIMDAQSVSALHGLLESERISIDTLVNNAAIAPRPGSLDELDADLFDEEMRTQVVGPMRVTKAVLPALRRGKAKRIVHVSSNLGSHKDAAGQGDNAGGGGGGGYYAYRAGKCALNIMMQCMAKDLEDEGFSVVCVHPGWVRTRMGGKDAPIDAVESQSGVFNVIRGLSSEDSGSFFDYRGERMAW